MGTSHLYCGADLSLGHPLVAQMAWEGKENLPQASPNVKCDNLNHWTSRKFSMPLGQKKD